MMQGPDGRVTIGPYERRSAAAEFWIGGGDKAPVLDGYAAVFNKESELIFGVVREVIRPGAFARSIKVGADVRLLFNHDPDSVMARTAGGSLRLAEDDVGLKVHAPKLDPEDFDVKRVLRKVKAGLVTAMSFGFETVREKTTGDVKRPLREVLEARLIDVSPATFPAYPQTTLEVRDRYEGAARNADFRRRQLQLAARACPPAPTNDPPILVPDADVPTDTRRVASRAARAAAHQLRIPVPAVRFFRPVGWASGYYGLAPPEGYAIVIRHDLPVRQVVETVAHECAHRRQFRAGQIIIDAHLEDEAMKFGVDFASTFDYSH